MLSATRSAVLEKPTLVPSSDAASEHCPMASASEEGPPLSGQGLDLASAPRAVVPSCLGHQRVPADLPSGVLNTITQARAPSTRRLYSSKWSVFSSWCTARGVSPPDCGVTEVLSFSPVVISLSALPVSDEEGDASFLCPVWALIAYVSRSSVFRQTEQLFVSFSGRSKGLAASKQSLSRWIVDAIALVYTSKADFASLDPERKPRRLSQAPSGISASEAAGRHLAAFSRRFC
ncbi:hypothetical protein PO909_013031 [Leuciscus waleckii]